jgi:hypothetical protein
VQQRCHDRKCPGQIGAPAATPASVPTPQSPINRQEKAREGKRGTTQALVRSRTMVHGHLHLHQLTAWKALTTRYLSAARLLMACSRLSGLNDPPITLYSIFLSR